MSIYYEFFLSIDPPFNLVLVSYFFFFLELIGTGRIVWDSQRGMTHNCDDYDDENGDDYDDRDDDYYKDDII